MKTLVIQYLPSGKHSNTGRLLDIFRKELGARASSMEVLDLIADPAPTFNLESMAAYVKRNYGGNELTAAEAELLRAQDRLVTQLKAADIVVMAYPMHNFGMPGPVKSYLDAIMMAGTTFALGKKVMSGRKALTLFTSGGMYPAGHASPEYPNWDTVSVLAKIDFGFMGFDESEVISTSLKEPEKMDQNLNLAQEQIRGLIRKWYQ